VIAIQLLEPFNRSFLDFVNAESAIVVSVPLLKEGVDVETLGLRLPCQWDCADYNENNELDQGWQAHEKPPAPGPSLPVWHKGQGYQVQSILRVRCI
jgi:hypothetical protein